MALNAHALAIAMVSKWDSQIGKNIPRDQNTYAEAKRAFEELADLIASSVVEHIKLNAEVQVIVAAGIPVTTSSGAGATSGTGTGKGKVI